MGCSRCGTTDLGRHLGQCGLCIGLALVSAVVFWAGYGYLRNVQHAYLLDWIALGFAILVTLLFIAHTLAYLARFRNRERAPASSIADDPPNP